MHHLKSLALAAALASVATQSLAGGFAPIVVDPEPVVGDWMAVRRGAPIGVLPIASLRQAAANGSVTKRVSAASA